MLLDAAGGDRMKYCNQLDRLAAGLAAVEAMFAGPAKLQRLLQFFC
jgi:hypothetical protein